MQGGLIPSRHMTSNRRHVPTRYIRNIFLFHIEIEGKGGWIIGRGGGGAKGMLKFDAFSVFTGYVFGCKHSLQLKNSSKLRLNKQISRNLHKYNTYSTLRRPDVRCFHNVNLARLVTSLTL